MGNQNPHTARPALPPQPWTAADNNRPAHGLQSSERWSAGEGDGRDICDQVRAAGMWRLSVFASEHVLIDVQFGTSLSRQFRGLRTPLVMYVPGQLTVSAKPQAVEGEFLPAYAMCTCTPVSSSNGSSARYLETVAGALPDDAAYFFALAASVVRIVNPAVNVDATLVVGDRIPLLAGSQLLSGAGYVEFES